MGLLSAVLHACLGWRAINRSTATRREVRTATGGPKERTLYDLPHEVHRVWFWNLVRFAACSLRRVLFQLWMMSGKDVESVMCSCCFEVVSSLWGSFFRHLPQRTCGPRVPSHSNAVLQIYTYVMCMCVYVYMYIGMGKCICICIGTGIGIGLGLGIGIGTSIGIGIGIGTSIGIGMGIGVGTGLGLGLGIGMQLGK